MNDPPCTVKLNRNIPGQHRNQGKRNAVHHTAQPEDEECERRQRPELCTLARTGKEACRRKNEIPIDRRARPYSVRQIFIPKPAGKAKVNLFSVDTATDS